MERGHATAEHHHDDDGAGGPPAVDLYRRDFRAWALEQARALHQAGENHARGDAEAFREAAAALDYANLSEELASLGRSESRELRSRLATVVEHLLKAQHSPAAGPRAGWRGTVQRTRREIARLLEESPSLKPELPDLLGEAAEDAVAPVAADMEDRGEGGAGTLAAAMREALHDYTPERVLDPDWWPPMARADAPRTGKRGGAKRGRT